MSFSDREDRAERLFEDLSETRGASPPDASEPLPDFARYKVRGRLGEGATAVVYRAWDLELRREVALKVLRPGGPPKGATRERFRREARTAAALVHPNVLTVHDAGEENGLLYLVLEIVDGPPFGAGRPREERLAILEEAARGVGAAHRAGVVHRDLKPANILVTAQGRAKVADFGLAHLMEGEAELTRTGLTLGTPLYMAPEQVGGRGPVSPRTDVYALGAILYEVLTGRPPFRAGSIPELYGKILDEDPVPPRRLDPAVPPGLERLCLAALEKHPGRRPADADAFADDLRRHREGEAVRARPLNPALRPLRAAARSPSVRAAALGALAFLAFWALRPRGEAVDDPRLPRLERVRGRVLLQSESGASLAREGTSVPEDRTLQTLSDGSRARVAFPDGRALEVLPRASVRISDVPGLDQGAVEAGAGVRVRTTDAEVEVESGLARVEAVAGGTRVDVESGLARQTRRADGRTAAVAAGRYAATHGGPELAVRPSDAGEIVLEPGHAVLSGSDWTRTDGALEARARRVADDWKPILEARQAGTATFTFHAQAGRLYSVWVRAEAPARHIHHDAIFLEFPDTEFVRRPKRIWAFLDVEGMVINGFYRNPGAWWVGGDADADNDVPPTQVRFRRTGLQTLRVYPFETPVRLEAIWLSSTRSARPAPSEPLPR